MAELDPDVLYELVAEAVRDAMGERDDGGAVALSRRMVGGHVVFRDSDGRIVKEVDATVFFKKVTAVREKLRVLEQKLNNHAGLDTADKADLQTLLTRAYGSLTTFNFLFREDDDKFRGSGG